MIIFGYMKTHLKKGDEVLLNIVKKTSFRKRVYLSATFTDDELLNKKSTSLNRRYHKHDLPVPCVVKGSKTMQVIKLFSFIIKYRNFPKLIFVPTIKTGKTLAVLLFIFKQILFTSKVEDKNKLFSLIKTGKKKTIICTTILERGITLKNLQVAVYNANHRLFGYQTLIQIAGRVGRKKDAPLGKVIFFAENYTNDINRCLEEIVDKNNEIKT